MTSGPRVAGLFAGIGGIELGFERAGFETVGLCEIDDAGRAVLKHRFPLPENRYWRDVTQLKRVPSVDVLTAGFPCQDLSQAGRKSGIRGAQSGLVGHVFRLIDEGHIGTVLLENVSYMLRLDKGEAMSFLVREFEERGYSWAYRVVDARSFGIPQRRQRVLLVASRSLDPSAVLHADDASCPEFDDTVGEVDESSWYGFYWTEGLRGLGWTKDGVPTVKGGSRLGIPSPPAIWNPRTGDVGTPALEDVEALQGFPRGWTAAADGGEFRKGARWHLVGNAVCVPMSHWVADRMRNPGVVGAPSERLSGRRWPLAARGAPNGEREAIDVSVRIHDSEYSIEQFLLHPLKPLSAKATRGFIRRAEASKLRFSEGFLASLRDHLHVIENDDRSAA
jgi:DNA (cytosine-5)-methyltransferase 1